MAAEVSDVSRGERHVSDCDVPVGHYISSCAVGYRVSGSHPMAAQSTYQGLQLSRTRGRRMALVSTTIFDKLLFV